MSSLKAFAALASVVVAASVLPAEPDPARAAPEPGGIAAFTRHARFVDAKISPKGTYLAAVATEGGRRSLTFLDLATHKPVWRLKPGDAMVGNFYWVSDERVVIELWDQSTSDTASPVTLGEIYAVDATGKNGRFIFGYRGGEQQTGSNIRRGEMLFAWGFVLDTLPDDPRHVLVEASSWDEPGDSLVRIYKVDVHTGVKDLLLQGPVVNTGFVTDEKGETRLAFGHSTEGKRRLFFREPGAAWREITGSIGLTEHSHPASFYAKDRTLYVVEPGENGIGLWAVGIDTGARRLVANTGIVPPRHVVRDEATRRIVAVESVPDLPRYDYVDPKNAIARALRGLEDTFTGEHVRFLNATKDDKKAVVLVYGDRNPGRFFLLDVDKMSAEELVDVRPWIKPDDMAETSAFHITASDGFRIHGYVTLPLASPGNGPPPLVVVPHGGPHGVRDAWGFDPTVQLLAKEGFAVLQVNYRGSGGYGEAYEEAGYRHWGDRVVQDIVDATRFAVRKGFGDGRRVCIFGASFGAYAALQGAILAPDLFRCAVGYAGIYDLTLMASKGDVALRRLGRAYVKTVLGDDEAALKRISPVYNADKLKARVMLIHGEEDRRAPIEHAELIKKALEKAGNPPAWLVEPREGHGFYDEGALERMYARVLAFLRENTAPQPAAAPAAAAR